MTTKTTSAEKPGKGEKAEQPERQTTRAADLFEPVSKAVQAAGPEGLTLAEIADTTGIRGRVLSNVLYRLVKLERVRRIQEGRGRRVRYATTEAQPRPRKRAPRKAPAAKKATATKAA